MADIVLINPRFEVSYWGMENTLPFIGKRANLPVSSLPLLAALTPDEHTITILDENIEPIDWDRCARADIVGVTGLSVQRFRMKEVLGELKRLGKFTIAGGAWITVQEDAFGPLADVIFIGEAEETWPQFLDEWKAGNHAERYEQAEKTDMTKVPVPRFDLLKMNHYAFGSLQFSRGCPFQCEFCDIIVTFGRRPRLKQPEQVVAELEAIRKTGMLTVFIVDDNLIGNKKAIKEVLRAVIDWQQANGYPLALFTEASIDLADDQELMDMMVEANFIAVFIGIESPSDEALKETKKFQNLRTGGTLLEKVHRVQASGMTVWCGMIVGFDSDDQTIFDRQIEFVQKSRIPFAMCGALYAIPKTPLHDRLAIEGRLDPNDPPEYGTNVIPLLMSREELHDGYLRVVKTLYDPEVYFERTEALFLQPDFDIGYAKSPYWKTHRLAKLRVETISTLGAIGLFIRLMMRVPSAALRKEYRKRLWRLLKVHRRPGLVLFYLIHIAMHYHANKLAYEINVGKRSMASTF